MAEEEETDFTTDDCEKPVAADAMNGKMRRQRWCRLLKWSAWISASIVVLLFVAVCSLLIYFSPGRLTDRFNRYASDFFDADVHAGRVEATFWSTFPQLKFKIDDLTIVSRDLRNLSADERALLPADADSLMSVERISVGINFFKAINGKFDLKNVSFRNPKLNMVVANDSTNNFNAIFLKRRRESRGMRHKISFNHCEVSGEMAMRMRLLKDSVDIQLSLTQSELTDNGSSGYTVEISGVASARFADHRIPFLPFSIDGSIDRNSKQPQQISLRNFTLSVATIPIRFSTLLTLDHRDQIDSLKIDIPDLPVGKLLRHAPSTLNARLGPLKELDTDLKMSMITRLQHPYTFGSHTLPSFTAHLWGEADRLRFEDLNLNKLSFDLNADIDGADIDRSVIKINKLTAQGLDQALDSIKSFSELLSKIKQN